ncbi:MAG TPA: hypothetical protein DCZ69_07430 [Syntrophobacteraceae bacterium]|jgi:hypothetical protein|nr:hypothetical protein [Syntrophobacteraceae bacterium]
MMASNSPFTAWDDKPTTSPTALMATSKFKNTTVVRIGSLRRLNRPLNPVQLEWLQALGLQSDIFTVLRGVRSCIMTFLEPYKPSLIAALDV